MNKIAKRIGYITFAIFLFALDQITKHFAFLGGDVKAQGLGSGGGLGFLENLRPVFGRQLFSNSQYAFSLPVSIVWIFIIDIFLLSFLVFWFWKVQNKNKKVYLAMALIFVGAFANIFDRITLGYVRDFIYVFWGNIFNFADIYIVLGILLMLF